MRNIFIQGFLYFSQFIKGLVTVPGTRRHSREELLHAPAGMIHLLATEKFSTTKKKKKRTKIIRSQCRETRIQRRIAGKDCYENHLKEFSRVRSTRHDQGQGSGIKNRESGTTVMAKTKRYNRALKDLSRLLGVCHHLTRRLLLHLRRVFLFLRCSCISRFHFLFAWFLGVRAHNCREIRDAVIPWPAMPIGLAYSFLGWRQLQHQHLRWQQLQQRQHQPPRRRRRWWWCGWFGLITFTGDWKTLHRFTRT